MRLLALPLSVALLVGLGLPADARWTCTQHPKRANAVIKRFLLHIWRQHSRRDVRSRPQAFRQWWANRRVVGPVERAAVLSQFGFEDHGAHEEVAKEVPVELLVLSGPLTPSHDSGARLVAESGLLPSAVVRRWLDESKRRVRRPGVLPTAARRLYLQSLEKMRKEFDLFQSSHDTVRSLAQQHFIAAVESESKPRNYAQEPSGSHFLQVRGAGGDDSRQMDQLLITFCFGRSATFVRPWLVGVRMNLDQPPKVVWASLRPASFAKPYKLKPLLPHINPSTFYNMSALYQTYDRIGLSRVIKKFVPPREHEGGAQAAASSAGGGALISSTLMFDEVPVFLLSSSGFRELAARDTSWLLLSLQRYINNRSPVAELTVFTCPHWARTLNGQDEAASLFLTVNLLRGSLEGLQMIRNMQLQRNRVAARLRDYISREDRERTLDVPYWTIESQGVLRSMPSSVSVDLLRLIGLAGIVNIGDTALEVGLPVAPNQDVAPLPVVSVRGTYLSSEFPELSAIFTTFNGRGYERAYSFLVRHYCHNQHTCHFPCLPRAFRSECVTGPPSEVEKAFPAQTAAGAPWPVSRNYAESTALYCDMANPLLLADSAAYWACTANHFNPAEPLQDRLAVRGCNELRGTGDFGQCASAVEKYLFHQEVPTNEDAKTSSQATFTPAEMGQLVSPPLFPLLVNGVGALKPALLFTAIGLMPQSTHDQTHGDLKNFAAAAETWCHAALGETVERDSSYVVDVTTWDYCFMASYAYAFLRILGYTEQGAPPVWFQPDFRSEFGNLIGQWTWEYGVLLHRMLQSDFVTSAYTLRASHWRAIMRDA